MDGPAGPVTAADHLQRDRNRREYCETIDNSMKAEILLVKIMSALGTFNCCLLRYTIDPLN